MCGSFTDRFCHECFPADNTDKDNPADNTNKDKPADNPVMDVPGKLSRWKQLDLNVWAEMGRENYLTYHNDIVCKRGDTDIR